MLRNLNINDIDHLKKELEDIDVDPRGIDIMLPKGEFHLFKTDKLNSSAAVLLKEKMLDLNAECAIAQDAVMNSGNKYPTILMGTRDQFELLVKKLNTEGYPELLEITKGLRDYFASRDQGCLVIRDKKIDLNHRTLIMGILNLTPDSFSDGGQFSSKEEAVEFALKMEEDGADIIDIGGESTRPGAEPVSLEEELDRVIPVIKDIRKKSDVFISIDTYKSEVARAALSNGADIVNDISGLRFDSKMPKVVAKNNAALVLMHLKGTPQNMQDNPEYTNIYDEILNYLETSIEKAKKAGVPKNKIILDPGIGFGKHWEDNYLILKHLKEFKSTGYPLMIGPSRKSFIGNLLDLPVNQRLEGTLATVTAGIIKGADLVRVHDVREVTRAVKISDKIIGKR